MASLAEPRHFGALERGLVDGEDASQASEADPQLMRPLDIVQLADHHEIRGDLIEAIAKDVARRLFGDLVRIDRNRPGVLGRQRRFDPPFLGKKIAARRFGEPGKLQASLGKQFVRNVEQSCRAAFEQFDLRFAQFGRASLGADLSDIDRQFRAGAILERQLACGTLDDGLADGQQRGAIHVAKDLLADRYIRDRFQTHPPARRGVLHLADLRQAAMDFSLGLDGLYPAPPVAPEPQRDSRLLQGVLGRVQIDASERSPLGGAARQLQRLQARKKLSRRQSRRAGISIRFRSCDSFVTVLLELADLPGARKATAQAGGQGRHSGDAGKS